MRVLVTGHLTGEQATQDLAAALPAMRVAHQADAILVNADNTAITGPRPMGGSGTTPEHRDLLLRAGADLILTGTHLWDAGNGPSVVDHPQVLRSANYADSTLPGHGSTVLRRAGEQLTILQLSDPSAPDLPVTHPYRAWEQAATGPATLVHLIASAYHASVFAHAVDGRCAAVVNSLSHIASRDLCLLPGGTAFVPDVGYVGPPGGIGGFDPQHFVADYLGQDHAELPPYRHTAGPTQMSAVLVEINTATGAVGEVSWVLALDPVDAENIGKQVQGES
jgi:calcineurin-like phosphoesterase